MWPVLRYGPRCSRPGLEYTGYTWDPGIRASRVYPGLGAQEHPMPGYGKGFDAESPKVGAGSLSYCWFLGFLLVFLGLPAGFSTPLALF